MSYGPQPGWGGPPHQQGWHQGGVKGGMSPEAYKLNSDGQTWLIVAIAGWFVGAVIITGPLAWYMANDLRRKAEQMGIPEPDNVRWARIAGMVSSIAVLAMIVLFVFLMLFVFVGVAANVHAN